MLTVVSTNVHQFLKDMKQRLNIIMVGDLSREDAKEFWEEYLPANNPSTPVPSLHLNFDDVYDVFGGHMFHLKQCYLRGIRPELTTIVKMALVRWKLFV